MGFTFVWVTLVGLGNRWGIACVAGGDGSPPGGEDANSLAAGGGTKCNGEDTDAELAPTGFGIVGLGGTALRPWNQATFAGGFPFPDFPDGFVFAGGLALPGALVGTVALTLAGGCALEDTPAGVVWKTAFWIRARRNPRRISTAPAIHPAAAIAINKDQRARGFSNSVGWGVVGGGSGGRSTCSSGVGLGVGLTAAGLSRDSMASTATRIMPDQAIVRISITRL